MVMLVLPFGAKGAGHQGSELGSRAWTSWSRLEGVSRFNCALTVGGCFAEAAPDERQSEQRAEDAEVEDPGGKREEPDDRQGQPAATEQNAADDEDEAGGNADAPSGLASKELEERHWRASLLGGRASRAASVGGQQNVEGVATTVSLSRVYPGYSQDKPETHIWAALIVGDE